MWQQGQAPDVITYNAFISTREKARQPERALGVLQAIQQQGLMPDVITCSAFISTCVKGK